MARNDNLAYDVSITANPAAEREQQQAQVKMRKPTQRHHISIQRAVLLMAGALIACGILLASQVQLTKVNDNLSEATAELTLLQSSGSVLDAELQARLSITNIDDYAVNTLGLVKADSSQYEYVNYSHQSKVVAAEGSGQSIWETILSWF